MVKVILYKFCGEPSLNTRVSEYKSTDVSKKIYYSASFLALKMAAIVHTGDNLLCPLSEITCTFRQGAQKVQLDLSFARSIKDRLKVSLFGTSKEN